MKFACVFRWNADDTGMKQVLIPLKDDDTKGLRVRESILARLEQIPMPPGVYSREGRVDYALHVFCEQFAPAKSVDEQTSH